MAEERKQWGKRLMVLNFNVNEEIVQRLIAELSRQIILQAPKNDVVIVKRNDKDYEFKFVGENSEQIT